MALEERLFGRVGEKWWGSGMIYKRNQRGEDPKKARCQRRRSSFLVQEHSWWGRGMDLSTTSPLSGPSTSRQPSWVLSFFVGRHQCHGACGHTAYRKAAQPGQLYSGQRVSWASSTASSLSVVFISSCYGYFISVSPQPKASEASGCTAGTVGKEPEGRKIPASGWEPGARLLG